MKRSCKNINLQDPKELQRYVYDCLSRHYKRYDFRGLLKHVGRLTVEEYNALVSGDRSLLEKASANIAEECARQIREKKLELSPCHIRIRIDKSTRKIRMIGKEAALQQCFDYIAVGAAEEIWKRRILPQQASSIKDRGPCYGVKMISDWVAKDKRAASWAAKHHKPYTRKCRYHEKLDIKQCYPSCRRRTFIRRFRRDCANEDLIWLWDELLKTHRVPLDDGTMYEGFMIGALPSQWACQYLLSFAYRHVMGLHTKRRGKLIKLVSHAIIFMDDILLLGSSRKNLKTATKSLIAFIREELGLTVKPTWQILRIEESPIDMMGYRIHQDGNVTARERVFLRARRIALRIIRKGSACLRRATRILSYKGFFRPGKHRRTKIPLRTHRIGKKLQFKWIFKVTSHVVRMEARKKNENIVKRAA